MAAVVILVACTVFNSGYALRTTPRGVQLMVPTLILAIAILLIFFRRIRSTRALVLSYLSLSTALVLSCIANYSAGALANTVVPLLVITLAYLIVSRVHADTLVEAYISMMKAAVAIALAVFVAVNFLDVQLALPVVINGNGVAYRNGILFFLLESGGSYSPALGPFWEPGLFASFIAVAAALEVCAVRRAPSRLALYLFAAGLLATGSTAGLLLLVMVGLILITRKMSRFRVPTALAGATGGVLAFMYTDTILGAVSNSRVPIIAKIVNLADKSVLTRVNSPLLNLMIFREAPAFGVGLVDVGAQYASYASSLAHAGAQTSTSTYMLAALGVWGGVYTMLWLVGVMRSGWLSVAERILILAMFLMIINKEPHFALVGTYCLLFYFIARMAEPEPVRQEARTPCEDSEEGSVTR